VRLFLPIRRICQAKKHVSLPGEAAFRHSGATLARNRLQIAVQEGDPEAQDRRQLGQERQLVDGRRQRSQVEQGGVGGAGREEKHPGDRLLSWSLTSNLPLITVPDEEEKDPLVDDEILELMDEEYYGEHFDASKHELKVNHRSLTPQFVNEAIKKLPGVLDQNVINGDRQRLLAQLRVVTKRVFAGILDKQSSCNQEMKTVEEVTDSH